MVCAALACYHRVPFFELKMVSMVFRIRPFATMRREPRQARKGATVTVALGAGDRRVRDATLPKFSNFNSAPAL
jgi:hypothetical protein